MEASRDDGVIDAPVVDACGLQDPWYVPEAAVILFVPAHKCLLPYIAGGWEAHGHYSSLRAATVTPFFRRWPHLRGATAESRFRIAGIPWSAYREVARFGLRWARARAVGHRGYEEYATWRFCLGTIRGHRERWREGRAAARTSITASARAHRPRPSAPYAARLERIEHPSSVRLGPPSNR